MKRLLLLLSSGILIIGVVKADQNQTEQTRCIDQTKEVFKRLNDLSAKNHFPPLDFDPTHLTVTARYDHYWKLNLWEIHIAPQIFIQCLPEKYTPVEFYRDTYKGAPLYDSPPKPTWTPEQAIENAKEWVRAVLNYFPDNVATPKIGFKNQMNAPGYYDGHWQIRWDRIDSQGHRFSGDALTVVLSEKRGLMSMGLVFTSSFDEIQGDAISQEEAISASRSPAETLLHGDLTRPLLPPGLQLGAPAASLWIMNPNHILQCKTLEEAAALEETKARLAWVVVYALMNGSAPASYHTLEIWVDAQTKEILGGDFK